MAALPHALDGNERAVNRVKAGEDALLVFKRRNEMLGYGLLGTIVVVVVVVWLIRGF